MAPAKLGGPPSAKLSHRPLGCRPRKGKKQDCGARSLLTLRPWSPRWEPGGCSPCWLEQTLHRGAHRAPGGEPGADSPSAQRTHDTLPTLPRGMKCPAPPVGLGGKTDATRQSACARVES